jgi:lipid-A-disaccharide synthase
MHSEIVRMRPNAVILIDYPGFNLRLAKALREKMPDLKIIYYISPQVWAWNRRRIPQMACVLDLMLCIFPFEKELYERSGLKTVFVGHPLLDSLAVAETVDTRDPKLVALLPGSREKEVRKLFPIMLEVAEEMHRRDPALRFESAAASHPLAETMRQYLRDAGPAQEWCTISLHSAHSLMQRAAGGMIASGTATLEAAFFNMPMVILYKVAWLTWIIGKRLVKIPFLGMPNILAGREIVREFLQAAAEPNTIATEMLRLLNDRTASETMRHELAAVIAALGKPGAAERAAAAIAGEVGLADAR